MNGYRQRKGSSYWTNVGKQCWVAFKGEKEEWEVYRCYCGCLGILPWRWIGHQGMLAAGAPIEIAGVDDNPPDVASMSPNPLRCTLHNDVSTMLCEGGGNGLQSGVRVVRWGKSRFKTPYQEQFIYASKSHSPGYLDGRAKVAPCAERVVNNQWKLVLLCNSRYGFKIRNVEARVSHRLI